MSNIGYALRAEYDGTVEQDDGSTVPIFTGGILAVDGTDFDVRAALDAGDGTIVVDENNTALILRLDEYPALKRVPVADEAAGDPITGWDSMTVARLREELAIRDLDTSGNKADLVGRLTVHEAAVSSGDAVTAANPDEAAAGEPATTTEG